ncbi:TetR/AcrR family transcriptional regulator [Umezawaea sp. Da 62-37]|uniref:TetR/AcrR family transcriptional regulator n=1 Tax=Umezawaea sp. Da 62-37 TaxID=3075927 RepID=UPI0028F71D3C|nr:TetR/AcrR family transcriptional regulator [Umezawaea sp. Da 62-37]WNV84600.1 TetR/AcrR family transcriptional regulator [Umezawaea sp. Da 62-37]
MTESPARGKGRGARERVLVAATTLFQRHGINATTMEQVAAAAPVSKRTLYAHFPAKDDLMVGYLRHLSESGATLEAMLDRTDLSPREQLRWLFTIPDGTNAPIRGCPFTDAAAEFPDPESPVHRYALERKRRFPQQLAELAARLGAVDPEALGEQLAILADGAAGRAMVLNDGACMRYGLMAAEALVDAQSRRPE